MAVRKSVRIPLERQCFMNMIRFIVIAEVIDTITIFHYLDATKYSRVVLFTIKHVGRHHS